MLISTLLVMSACSSDPTRDSYVEDVPTTESPYQCDGRTYCSEMDSYEEAKYFLDNCPNTEMDGDNDGIPCEMQF